MDGGTRIGSVRKVRQWAVIEADESDRSLMASTLSMRSSPTSADHFGLMKHWRSSPPSVRGAGTVIDGRGAGGGPAEARTEGWGGSFQFEGVTYQVPMPGLHNVHNAWHAVRMARALGAAPERLVAALAAFGGVERRLQRVGRCGAATVVDDYAHNPEKLAAAWTTLATAFPSGCCLAPHGMRRYVKCLRDWRIRCRLSTGHVAAVAGL